MSTPNPLAPLGSLLEQQAKGRSTFHVISFIGGVHVMLLCGILWTACSKDEKTRLEGTNTTGNVEPYTYPAGDVANGVTPLGNVGNTVNPTTNALASTPAGGTFPATPATGAGNNTPPVGSVTPQLPPSTPIPTANAGGSNTSGDNTTSLTGGGEYKVAKGDIGEAIAKKHGVSMKALAAANPEVNWNRLKVGQPLKIAALPAPVSSNSSGGHDSAAPANGLIYTVKGGDTGTRIAAKHNVKWVEIRRLNNLKSDALHPGQKLTIPVRAGAAATGDTTPTPVPIPAGAALQPTAVPVPRGPGQ